MRNLWMTIWLLQLPEIDNTKKKMQSSGNQWEVSILFSMTEP